jgi:hypothetical protein
MIEGVSSTIPCIKDGLAFKNGKDYSDVGECSGELFTQVLDASF